MTELSSESVQELDRLYDNFFVRGGHAPQDIYDKRRDKWPYDHPVGHIYLYYVAIADDGRLEVKHYEFTAKITPAGKWSEISYDDAKQKIYELVQNSIDGDQDHKPEPDINFRNVNWRRRSYIAIVADEKYWTLFDKGSKNPPVTFLPRMKDGKAGTSNHTFFDAEDLKVPVTINGKKDVRSGLMFINHFKLDDSGQDMSSVVHKQHFHFNLYFNVAFSAGNDPDLVVIFDPGGTNQGPPLEP